MEKIMFEEKELSGYEIDLIKDNDPSNPRDNFNLAQIVYFSKEGNIGDLSEYSNPGELLAGLLRELCPGESQEGSIIELYERLKSSEKIVCYPLYPAFQGKGLEIDWYINSTPHGFIYVTKADLLADGCEEDGWLEEADTEILLSLREFNDYLTEEVYKGVLVKKETGDVVSTTGTNYGKPFEEEVRIDLKDEAFDNLTE